MDIFAYVNNWFKKLYKKETNNSWDNNFCTSAISIQYKCLKSSNIEANLPDSIITVFITYQTNLWFFTLYSCLPTFYPLILFIKYSHLILSLGYQYLVSISSFTTNVWGLPGCFMLFLNFYVDKKLIALNSVFICSLSMQFWFANSLD